MESQPQSASPPSYVVYEDSKGNLVNKNLNVVWPERPRKGRHSKKEYDERRKKQEKLRHEMEKASERKDLRDTSPLPPYSEGDHFTDVKSLTPPSSLESGWYVGVMPLSQMRALLKPTQFRLFYMRPEYMTSFNDVPVEMPLMLAYMSSAKRIYSFGFTSFKLDGKKYWRLRIDSDSVSQQPSFPSLVALLNYYNSYVNIRCDNGSAELFPVYDLK